MNPRAALPLLFLPGSALADPGIQAFAGIRFVIVGAEGGRPVRDALRRASPGGGQAESAGS